MQAVRDTKAPVQKTPTRILINKDLLPSRGRYYTEDLYAKKLSAIEMKNLSKITKANINQTFNRALEAGISGIDIDKIKLNDRLWLIYYLRSITYDDLSMKVLGICPKCERTHWYDYQLKDLDVVYADRELERELRLVNGDVVTLAFPTIEDEREIEATKMNPVYGTEIDTDVMTVASHIKSINGAPCIMWEAYTYFVNGKGSAQDYARLMSHLRKFAFGARPNAKFKCSCGQELFPDVPLGSDFFLPDF